MSSYSWLIDAIITSSIVAIVIVVVRLILKEKLSGKLKYYLWAIFLVRLMAIPLPESTLSIYNLIPEKNTVQEHIKVNNTTTTSDSISSNIASQNNSINNTNSNIDTNINNKNSSIKKQNNKINTITLGIYKVMVIVFLLASTMSYLCFIYRIKKKCILADGEVLEQLEVIKRRLNIRRKITLVYGDTPFIYGIFKVKLVIPKGLINEELDSILLHELIHYKYGDLLINWLLVVLKSIYWFNPIVWLVFKQIRKDCEVACDERVLESRVVDKKSYATVLFKNALKGNRYLVGTSSFSKGGRDIKGRIKLIQKFNKRKTLWVVVGVIIFVLVGVICLTNSIKLITDVNISESDSKVITQYLNEKLNDDIKSVGEPYVAFKVLGATDEEIYLWALAKKGDSGISVPVLLNVDNSDGSMKILSYKIPRDGYGYGEEIEGLFPKYIQKKISKVQEDNTVKELDKEIENMKPSKDVKVDKNIVINGEIIQIRKAQITENQSYGTDMATLDFASDDFVIFHGYYGLFVYSLEENKIIDSLDLEYIDCDSTQGDNYCEVSISNDLNIIQLHNLSSSDMYQYIIRAFSEKEVTLIKMQYNSMENAIELIQTPEELKKSWYLTSEKAAQFKNGEIGYLTLTDGTINSLEYVRGDKRVKLFE